MAEANPDTTHTECAEEGCTRTRPDHAWGRIKSGWFEQKDGRAWCGEHTPEWVAEWRRKQAGYP